MKLLFNAWIAALRTGAPRKRNSASLGTRIFSLHSQREEKSLPGSPILNQIDSLWAEAEPGLRPDDLSAIYLELGNGAMQ
jgi:hypothetical protein